MDIIQNLNLATAGELTLASFLIALIVQGIKATGKVNNNFIPLLSMFVGVLIGIVAVVATHDTNYVNGAVTGLIIGGTTSGLVDLTKGATSSVRNLKLKKDAKQAEMINQAVAELLKREGDNLQDGKNE